MHQAPNVITGWLWGYREYMQGDRKDAAGLPETKDIALMIARCACNNHTICDDELRPVGKHDSRGYAYDALLVSLCLDTLQ